MSNSVPKGWSISPLKEHSTRIKRKNKELNVNVLTASAQHGLVNQREFFKKSVASQNLSNYTLLHRDDFAYNKSYSNGYPVGVVRRLSKYDKGVLSPLYICFSIDQTNVDRNFIGYHFDSYWFERQLNSVVQEGARAHGLLNIPVDDFFERQLLLPPLHEQKKIAAILSSVDDVIEKTQAQINKLKDLKTGMMQELLTKGIGHTEFKDSPVGRIPVGWEVVRLQDVTNKFQNGYAFSAKGYIEKGMPIISMALIGLDGNFNKNYKKTKYWDASEQENLSRYIVRNGDLLIAMTDVTPTMELIGRCCIADLTSDAFLNQRVGLISLNSERINKHFFAYYSNNEYWRSYSKGVSGLGAQANIGTSQILDGWVALPSLSEQDQIAASIRAVDKLIELKSDEVVAKRNVKKALMQDLLTGKVRVKLDKEEQVSAMSA
jgi:type I restriction enzyme S subunit